MLGQSQIEECGFHSGLVESDEQSLQDVVETRQLKRCGVLSVTLSRRRNDKYFTWLQTFHFYMARDRAADNPCYYVYDACDGIPSL